MKKLLKILLIIPVVTVFTVAEENQKSALKANYQMIYNLEQKKVDTLSEMFTEGNFYGRFRSNTFVFDWENETATEEDHYISGLGGSLVFKSASYHDIDFTTGLYYTHGFTNVSAENAANLKPGQDALSRFDYINTGSQDLGVIGQAYIGYTGLDHITLLLGRQLVESFYTKSNNSKMIPDTFDGVVIDSTLIQDTAIKLGYLAKEKHRGHANLHSVVAYGDENTTSAKNPEWYENDDIVIHKGLAYSRLNNAGIPIDTPLLIADLHNTSISNLKVDTSMYNLSELLTQAMAEANYNVALGKDLSLTPGLRYIKQFDNGAGAIGGAALSGLLAGQTGSQGGYKDASSLDGQMLAARLVSTYKNYKLNLGYSNVFDEADLLAPWRGFPTEGYTRSMLQYNWFANTTSYRAELTINSNKTGVYTTPLLQFSVLYTDADEEKRNSINNSLYYYFAQIVHNIPSMPELQWRLRTGYSDYTEYGNNNLDARLEFNYLF